MNTKHKAEQNAICWTNVVDNMVIIKGDDKLWRIRWKKGVMQELITGRDNIIRGTVVFVIDSRSKNIHS